MDRNNAVALSLVSLLLAACATNGYVEPSEPGAALLTIQNASTVAEAGIHTFKDGRDCSGGRLGIGNDGRLPPEEDVKVRVTTDQEFTLLIQYNLPAGTATERNCFVAATFVPRPGGTYLALATLEGNRCDVGVTAVTAAGEVLEPSFKLRKIRVSRTDKEASCE